MGLITLKPDESSPNGEYSMKETHPNKYQGLMDFGWLSFAVGLNFLFLKPAFDPLGIPKTLLGFVFMIVGIVLICALKWGKILRWSRWASAISVGWYVIYTGLLVAAIFQEQQTSAQLPIFVAYAARSVFRWTVDPFLNLTTQQMNGGDR